MNGRLCLDFLRALRNMQTCGFSRGLLLGFAFLADVWVYALFVLNFLSFAENQYKQLYDTCHNRKAVPAGSLPFSPSLKALLPINSA